MVAFFVPLIGIMGVDMRYRPLRRLYARALAVLLTAAAVLAAPVVSVLAAERCRACRACETPSGGAATNAAEDCCAATSADGVSGRYSSDDPSPRGGDCCPPGCTRCCVSQARATVPPVTADSVLPDSDAWVGHPILVPAPPPVGVHDSIFHPPRA